MTLEEAKAIVEAVEPRLVDAPFVVAHTFERNGKKLNLALTDRLRRLCERGHVWKTKPMLTAIKKAAYGFELHHAHSPGGYDGLFILTRDHRPENEMMKKLFDRFVDKVGSEADLIARELAADLDNLKPVRLVSHHLRLLGLLKTADEADTLVLVDYDDTK